LTLEIELWQAILALVGTVLAAWVPAILSFHNQRLANRSHAKAEEATAADQLTSASLDLVKQLREEYNALREEFEEYRRDTEERLAQNQAKLTQHNVELELQEKAIDNLTGQNLRLQLVLSIYAYQIKQLGFEPVIAPDEAQTMPLDDLRLRAEAASDSYHRMIDRRTPTR